MKFKVSAVLPMPAEAYFVERDSAAFRSLVAQMCKLEALEMGNSWMEGETEVYEFITKPDVERYVPSQFKHFLPGGDLHYMDVIEYDPKRIAKSPYRMRVRSVPPIFASKAKILSTLSIEEVTPDTCRQTLEGEIEIKIFGLGSVAEHIIVDNLKTVYKGVPKIVQRWKQFRDEVMKQPDGKDILVKGRPKNSSVDWINDRIRDLIQAPETDSDTASVSSGPTHQHSDRQSLDDALDQCSLGHATPPAGSEEEDDEFFDARETASWANLDTFLSSHAKSVDPIVQKDTRQAQELLNHASKTGRRLKRLEVDAMPAQPAGRKGKPPQRGVTSQRFSTTYNQDLEEWKGFWEEHKVPESKHAPDVEKRLGNLFGMGAALGLFKPHKDQERHHHHHFHLRRKHKDKHNREDSGATADTSTARSGNSLASHITEVSEEPVSHHGHSADGKSHKPSRSTAFVRDLFHHKHNKKSEGRKSDVGP